MSSCVWINHLDNFGYVCGKFTIKRHTFFIKVYYLNFGVKLGDEDKQ